MAFDSKSNLWVLSPTSSKLYNLDGDLQELIYSIQELNYSYNLDGDLQDEIEFENVPDGLVFSIDSQDQIIFLNKAQKCFYFQYF